MAERFTGDVQADLLNELVRVEERLRTATLDRSQLLERRRQLKLQLQQYARAS